MSHERKTCPTCGGERFFPKILPHPTEDAYCFDEWHESSPGAAEGATPQEQPFGYAYRYPDGIRFATNGRTINGNAPSEVIPLYARVGMAAKVETPPSLDVYRLNTLLGRLKRAVAEREPKQHYACALWTQGADSDGCGGCFSCMEADLNEITELMEEADREVAVETLQPASEPTVTLEEAKAWRQVNWYDSVPQQLDEGLRAFAQYILRRKTEAGQ